MAKLRSVNFTIWLLGILTAITTFAQSARIEQLRENEENRARIEAKIKADEERVKKAAAAGLENGLNNRGNLNTEENKVKFNSESELPAHEKKLLAADPNLLQLHSSFLQSAATGLCKILAFQEDKLAIRDARSQTVYPHMQGNGTYYSFAKRNHNPDEWAQIKVVGGYLQIGYVTLQRHTTAASGGMAQTFTYTSGYGLGLMTDIGDIPLEKIDREHPALKFLAALQPPNDYSAFAARSKEYFSGVKIGDSTYRAVSLAKVNTTYLLRSVLYKKSDTLIAFRILKQDSDGSLHILWQQLQSFPTPELKGKPPKP